MVNLGSLAGKKTLSTVTLVFRLPYYTQWGQSLLIAGSEPVLGSWNVKRGLALTPVHEGDELVWYGKVSVAAGFKCRYSYYLVDDERNILRWEAGKKRKLELPEGCQAGEVVEIHDLWQDASESVFFRSAFKDVIFGRGQCLEAETSIASIQKNPESQGFTIQFQICSPRIVEGAHVYVTGNAPQLGQFRLEDGLRLRYAGDYIWKASCVVRKEDFPIKYPFMFTSVWSSHSLPVI